MLISDPPASKPTFDTRGQFQGDRSTFGGKGFPIGMFIITLLSPKYLASLNWNLKISASANMFDDLSQIIVMTKFIVHLES